MLSEETLPPPAHVPDGVEGDVVQEGEDLQQDLGGQGGDGLVLVRISRQKVRPGEQRQPLAERLRGDDAVLRAAQNRVAGGGRGGRR